MKTLVQLQKELKVPKGNLNKFGGYKYRSAEDILEAVKPLLTDTPIILSDEMWAVGTRIYVKATASYGKEVVTAYAREAETKKGMDEAQITGSASSYARKYALCGLLAIADNDDPDSTNNHDKTEKVVINETIEDDDF